MSSTTNITELADKDKTNFIAAFLHHVDIIFSIISIVVIFDNGFTSMVGVALTLFILERLGQFFYSGIKTYKWSNAIMSLVFLDYAGEMCRKEEGRGMRLFKKKYQRVYTISSPFAVFCFYSFFEGEINRSLVLACGIIHLINTAQTNLEYYTFNIFTITFKQKIYVFFFIICEFFFRLVFLSYFKVMIGEGGIIGYQIGEFFVNFFLELIISKKEGQERSFWFKSTLQKAWAGAFYFRLEDTMVQDADEWSSDTRNLDNYCQQLRICNNFKSARSKIFIGFRFFENIFLLIVGIIEYSKIKSQTGLFALAILLLPLYLIWHLKYCRFRFQSNTQNSNLNDSAAVGTIQSGGNKYKEEEQAGNKYKDENHHIKPFNFEMNNHGTDVTPIQNKYNQKQENFNNYQNTYNNDEKKLNNNNINNSRGYMNSDATPPAVQEKHTRQKSSSNFNKNIDQEQNQLNSNHQRQKSNIQQQQLKGNKSSKYNSNPQQITKDSKQMQKLQDEQDYEDDDPYGQADVNNFAIE